MGQFVTPTIVEIGTTGAIYCIMHNIILIAKSGKEFTFYHKVTQIIGRVTRSTLWTSSSRKTVEESNIFLGEYFGWSRKETWRRNSVKR